MNCRLFSRKKALEQRCTILCPCTCRTALPTSDIKLARFPIVSEQRKNRSHCRSTRNSPTRKRAMLSVVSVSLATRTLRLLSAPAHTLHRRNPGANLFSASQDEFQESTNVDTTNVISMLGMWCSRLQPTLQQLSVLTENMKTVDWQL